MNDLNYGVTHWLHFIGFENPDPKDDATRILKYKPKSAPRNNVAEVSFISATRPHV